MRCEFLKQNTSNNLTLLFAGWAMSARDFRFLENIKTDLLVCSDYRTLDFETDVLKPYTNIRLVGFSLGVWVASYIFCEKEIEFSEKIAINGTQYPIDNERGTPVKIYEGTELQLSETSLRKFMLRMTGSKENFQEFMENTEEKSILQLKEELCVIRNFALQHDVSSFRWNKAIISTNDAIFPLENQHNAWNSKANIVEIDAPHFAQSIFKNLWIRN